MREKDNVKEDIIKKIKDDAIKKDEIKMSIRSESMNKAKSESRTKPDFNFESEEKGKSSGMFSFFKGDSESKSKPESKFKPTTRSEPEKPIRSESKFKPTTRSEPEKPIRSESKFKPTTRSEPESKFKSNYKSEPESKFKSTIRSEPEKSIRSESKFKPTFKFEPIRSEKSTSNWKKIALTFGIAIIFVLFIGFGIEAFYDSPNYNDFCSEDMYTKNYNTKDTCEANNGRWQDNNEIAKPVINDDEFVCTKGIENKSGEFSFNCRSSESQIYQGYCDLTFKCSQEYTDVNDVYNRNVFIICAIIGFIVIIIGAIIGLESVGTGLLIGGVLTVLYGTIRFWNELGDFVRFFLLGVILALLIYLGYKKIKD